MFGLVWMAVFFSVRGSDADTVTLTGASAVERQHCLNGSCITLIEGELTAEAGLCVVIPCSFTTGDGFRPTNMAWFKCKPSKSKCSDSDLIFHSNNYKKIQSGFKGRVSLLDPDVSQKNCSIMMNDLRESDSGSYQLRVNGLQGSRQDGFSFPQRATVFVKDLNQKPTVDIPPMTEGQQTTLTCTAPGLCSGSDPKFTWMWRGAGENDSHITGNITAFSTEHLTAATRRHSSTLTFISSAEHHSTNITCKISFTGNTTTQETETLNVAFSPRILRSSGCEVQSEVLTCVCTSEGFPVPTIKWPLLESCADYSVTTTVSNTRVSSTITVSLRDHPNATVECVSSNSVGEEKEKLDITVNELLQEDHHSPSAVLLLTIAVVSVTVNVMFIICFVFLWNSRKQVKPNQEDRTYMSLQKRDRSDEYDVIGQPLN